MTTYESFLQNVKDHKMETILDQGVYRHLRFSNGGFDMYFEVITGPGYLLYRGDMGCFEFERLPDMFDFFGGKQEGYINPGYWAQKCEVGPVSEFSRATFENKIRGEANEFLKAIEEREESWYNEFWQDVESMMSEVNSEESAYREIAEWDYGDYTHRQVFGADYWELDFTEYTNRFIWCLYAITWGIRKYEEFKQCTS